MRQNLAPMHAKIFMGKALSEADIVTIEAELVACGSDRAVLPHSEIKQFVDLDEKTRNCPAASEALDLHC